MGEALPSGPFGMYSHVFTEWHTKDCGINAEPYPKQPNVTRKNADRSGLAPECFTFERKGCGNIEEHTEELAIEG